MDYDYIIAGGGSSGCVTAWRLVKDHGARVLLLEAGPPDKSMLFRMPAGFFKMLGGSPYLNIYESEPQARLNGRTTKVPQANVLGGGSSVNAMIYMRGKPEEYDEWDVASGGAGWTWRHMLPHYTRLEGNQRHVMPLHGDDGPLKVSDHVHICDMAWIYLQTLQNMGVPFNNDFNSGRQHGVGFMQLTTDHGKRCSAATAFLKPILNDKRLTLKTGAAVTNLLFEGNRCIGVEYVQNGQVHKVRAANEVVLTSGSYVSPKLLMLSGIGPEAHLAEHGIRTRVDLPGVGQNLQDHHEVPVSAYTKGAYGYFGEERGLKMVVNGLQYLLFGTGPVSSNGAETCAFVNPETRGPDSNVKIYCVAMIYLDRDVADVRPGHGVTFTCCLMRPKARGSVTLRSANPMDRTLINPNFLGHPDDLRIEIAALRYGREILASRPMADTVLKEVLPGPGVQTDAELTEFCKRTVKTNYHPVGTCAMGLDSNPMAVVTPDLKVRGVENLRVFDASVMPNLISANTNAPTMAIADKAVGLMMGETPPPPAVL
ncbi:MAG: GMC family oxidoreductase N-terminal domain-containing protein [Rhizobiales bacterium]|nr:GMC family oxidoreductase N-terminal domain-containing protein [Hyphomicrobiales bacterium]